MQCVRTQRVHRRFEQTDAAEVTDDVALGRPGEPDEDLVGHHSVGPTVVGACAHGELLSTAPREEGVLRRRRQEKNPASLGDNGSGGDEGTRLPPSASVDLSPSPRVAYVE